MKGEIPVFKRCCCCLPLRYGLLVWGYFKMTADAILVSILTYGVINTLMFIRMYEKYRSGLHTELIVAIIAIVIFFTDFVVTIAFIVGGHKKNVKLIRVFYFLSIGMWVITCLVTALNVVTAIQSLIAYNLRYSVRVVLPLSFFFVVLAVQSYFLILLRSEIIKLRNNGEFRFVNNAAEAECTMTCEEMVVGEETVKEVVINQRGTRYSTRENENFINLSGCT